MEISPIVWSDITDFSPYAIERDESGFSIALDKLTADDVDEVDNAITIESVSIEWPDELDTEEAIPDGDSGTDETDPAPPSDPNVPEDDDDSGEIQADAGALAEHTFRELDWEASDSPHASGETSDPANIPPVSDLNNLILEDVRTDPNNWNPDQPFRYFACIVPVVDAILQGIALAPFPRSICRPPDPATVPLFLDPNNLILKDARTKSYNWAPDNPLSCPIVFHVPELDVFLEGISLTPSPPNDYETATESARRPHGRSNLLFLSHLRSPWEEGIIAQAA